MKKEFMKDFIIFITLIIILVFFDYINLPTLLGLEMSNISLDFCMGIFNTIIIIALYLITYRVLDKRTVQREKNKKEISTLLIRECYHECINYLQFLNQEIVEKYIVPKVDFNSTNGNTIINNLQSAPFMNESIILDLVKDGQMSKKQIEVYLKIKDKFRQYVNMRITFFDAEKNYNTLEIELYDMINNEIKILDKLP